MSPDHVLTTLLRTGVGFDIKFPLVHGELKASDLGAARSQIHACLVQAMRFQRVVGIPQKHVIALCWAAAMSPDPEWTAQLTQASMVERPEVLDEAAHEGDPRVPQRKGAGWVTEPEVGGRVGCLVALLRALVTRGCGRLCGYVCGICVPVVVQRRGGRPSRGRG